ncbi:MAG: hypothetical protein Q8P20_03790 [bacterium]|nr:hypothetical protein [bacterium]
MIELFKKTEPLQIVGVNIGESENYDLLLVTRINNKMEIKKSLRNLSFVEVLENLSKKYSLILHFSGNTVINRKIKKIPGYRSKALMNVDIDHFYFYEYHCEHEIFLSVVRKKNIDEIALLFTTKGYYVIDFSIGPFISTILKDFLSSDIIQSKDFSLLFENNSLIDFKPSEDTSTLRIGDLQLSSNETPLFGAALNYILPDQNIIYDINVFMPNRKEKKLKMYFETLGSIGLILLFATLLTNYIWLSSIEKETIEDTANLLERQNTYENIITLERERDNKKLILSESGFFVNNFLSFYINDIVSEIPETITLKSLSLSPLKKNIKNTEKLEFTSKTIDLVGVSYSNDNFNNWYKKIKDRKWVNKIDIVGYNNLGQEGSYQFNVKILIK